MASGNQGGRPRNAWTPARERKLVRLYTLTNLSKNEIQRVLEAPKFKPSTSDIQKKLRALFPKDYAKDHRRFRPSNGSNMAIRLRRIRQCGGGRISKARKASSKKKASNQKTAFWFLSCINAGIDYRLFDCSKKAFRDYSSPGFTQYSPLDPICGDSFPTVPELLMLDGSTLQSSTIPHSAAKEELRTTFKPAETAVAEWTLAKINHSVRSSKATSSLLSIRSIARRLGRPYSRSYLEQIQSVLRSSCSGSFRSSLLSLGSVRSFCGSISDPISEDSTSLRGNGNNDDHISYELRGNDNADEIDLGEQEQSIWDELVDNTQLTEHLLVHFRSYSHVWLRSRPCCQKSGNDLPEPSFLCKTCGFSSILFLASRCQEIGLAPRGSYSGEDFFGNTSGHYAAAGAGDRGIQSFQHFTAILERHINDINSFGQTVVHVLRLPQSPDQAFLLLQDLLAKLKTLDFDFSQRDYHGRRAIQALVEDNQDHLSKQSMELIMKSTHPNVAAPDIFGHTMSNTVFPKFKGIKYFKYKKHLLLRKTGNLWPPDFVSCAASLVDRIITNSYVINWVDDNGDTPIISILKIWPLSANEAALREVVEKLVQKGAEIHMRDRNGDTVLGIATIRGFRTCVSYLSIMGANIHARTFGGAGILKRASLAMGSARENEDMGLYSRILTCFSLLVDAGAKSNPSEYDEWIKKPEATTSQRRYEDPFYTMVANKVDEEIMTTVEGEW